jgi:hypothetical protein
MAKQEERANRGGVSRYPLKNTAQAKRTISRLVRDVLNNRIDKETFKAAIYGINSLIAIFRIEIPIKQIQDIVIGGPLPVSDFERIVNESPAEREKRIEELLPGYAEFQKAREAERAKRAGQEQDEMTKRAFENYRGHEPAVIEPPAPVESEPAQKCTPQRLRV